MKKLAFIQRSNGNHWVGDGFPVQGIFSYNDIADDMSPFLLMDYAGPVDFPPTTRKLGVGQHRHRGFETVTIVYEGGVSHRDSSGGGGSIGPGDVQWMTAASGLLHEEYHSPDYAAKGGPFEMVQLWVNLPAKDKMSAPGYQSIVADEHSRSNATRQCRHGTHHRRQLRQCQRSGAHLHADECLGSASQRWAPHRARPA
jgi:redox-sensitive bicupin YhaK (pirin superfamily)